MTKWSTGEISTLIYGVYRLGEKEFSDLMGQSLFMKREYELKRERNLAVTSLPDKRKHSVSDIISMWAQIKLVMNLDVHRLRSSKDSKLVTHQDWMISAMLALNRRDLAE